MLDNDKISLLNLLSKFSIISMNGSSTTSDLPCANFWLMINYLIFSFDLLMLILRFLLFLASLFRDINRLKLFFEFEFANFEMIIHDD